MKKHLWYIACLVSLVACKSGGNQGQGLLSSSGRSGEVLVVCSANAWNGQLGDSIEAVLMQPLIYLPQAEPMFTVSHISNNNFSSTYQKQRNIVYFDINENINEAKTIVKYNVWAEPQLLIRILSPTVDDAIAQLSNYKVEIQNLILTNEFKRFQRSHTSRQDFKIDGELSKTFKLKMFVPEGYFIAVKNENFAWLRKETKDWSQDILIYTQNYVDTTQFSSSYIVSLRDSLTHKYVFGSVDNSYMEVETILPPQSSFMPRQSNYTIRTEGLWKMQGDCMGGPFVNYSILDTSRNRIVTIDAFLYAPRNDKRDLLRQIEAILQAADFENNAAENTK